MTDIRALLVLVSVAIASTTACFQEPGVVSVTRIPGSERPAGAHGGGAGGAHAGAGAGASAGEDAAACPSGWNCMDLGALGLQAQDGKGEAVAFTCSKGAIMPCDDANPADSCKDLTNPFCAHVTVSGMQIVSCAQRCTP